MPKTKRNGFKAHKKKKSVSSLPRQEDPIQERKPMASMSDVKAWKEILNELKSSSEQNEVVISEIKEEIALQEQRNKQEVQKQYEQLRDQTQALENLLQTLKTGTLFSLPSDQDTLSSFEQTLSERLEFSRQLMEDAKTLLDSQTTAAETLEKLRNGSRRERNRSLLRPNNKEQLSKEDREAKAAQSLTAIANISTTGFPSLNEENESNESSSTSTGMSSKEAKTIRRNNRTSQSQEQKALPVRTNSSNMTKVTKTSWENRLSNNGNQEELAVRAKFPRQALLGNWIHYFSKDMFTCQCFWDDSEFKEYDFKNNELVEERSGKFHVKDGKVYMDYDEGRQAVYTVTGYSNDCLDYLINRTPIRFDYMPEELLNNLLENTSHYPYAN